MTPELLRLALFLASFAIVVIGVWLAFGPGLALMTLGIGGASAALILSYLAVTERPNA